MKPLALAALALGWAASTSAQDSPSETTSITPTAADMMVVAKNAYTCGVLDGALKVAKGTTIEGRMRELAKESENICAAVKSLIGEEPK